MKNYSIRDVADITFFDKTTGDIMAWNSDIKSLEIVKPEPDPIYYLLELNEEVDGHIISYFNNNGYPVVLPYIDDKPKSMVVRTYPPHIKYGLKGMDYVVSVQNVRLELS
jgi:hypothetical protein